MKQDRFGVNSILCPHVKQFVTAIIRAFGDEPVRLRVLRVQGRVIEVFNEDPGLALGVSPVLVYEDNDGVYAELREAYNKKDTKRLTKLWSEAPHFDLPRP